jgi:PAS domain S-box-containing protein
MSIRDSVLSYQKERSAMDSFLAFFDLVPVGFVTLDPKHIVRKINGSGAQLFGVEKKSLLGRPFKLWIDDASRGIYEEFYQSALETGCKTCEMRLLKGDGSIFDAKLDSLAIPNDKRIRENWFMFVVSDVSQFVGLKQRLEEANIALKVLFRQQEEDRAEIEKNILSNIRQLVIPHVEKLTKTKLTENQAQHVELIKTSIDKVISPFLRRLSANYGGLTSREIEITNMVRDGYTTKEISGLLYISPRSVEFHKDNIRKKMGLTNKKINLRSHLLSLEGD